MKQSNRPDLVSSLVKDEQSSLSQATNLTKNNANSETALTKVKQLSDMSFAVAGDSLAQAKGTDKEKLIDNIYASYQKNQKEVAPIVQKSLPTSPFNQPLVGTVQAVDNNKVTVAFTDGSTKIVLINPSTPSRAFGQKVLDQGTPQASVGGKIAVVGEMTKTGEIIPNFILRNVPKEIPEKKEGIVIKIDSQNNSLEIKQANGQNATVFVDLNTTIKGRDTNVSLNGIKAGSTITIFGSSLQSTQSATASQSAEIAPISTSSAKPNNSKNNSATPAATMKVAITQTPPKPPTPTVIKATTITVTKNSSGKNEVIETPKKTNSKPPETPTPKTALKTPGKK